MMNLYLMLMGLTEIVISPSLMGYITLMRGKVILIPKDFTMKIQL